MIQGCEHVLLRCTIRMQAHQTSGLKTALILLPRHCPFCHTPTHAPGAPAALSAAPLDSRSGTGA